MSTCELTKILKTIELAPVECDGFCRMASYLLSNAGIEHECFVGELNLEDGRNIPLHYWLVAQGKHIDYRARMWLGDDAPHGVFEPDASAHYVGNKVELGKITPGIFKMLSTHLSQLYSP